MDRLIALVGGSNDAHLLAVGKVLRAKGGRVSWLDPLELARMAEDPEPSHHLEVPHAVLVRRVAHDGSRGGEATRSALATERLSARQAEALSGMLQRWEHGGARVFDANGVVLTKEQMTALPLFRWGELPASLDAAHGNDAHDYLESAEPLSAFVADGELLAAFRHERSELDPRSGASRYTPLVLGSDLSALCKRVARLLRVRFAEVRALRIGDGIEVTTVISGPDFLELENQTGVPMTEKLCDALLSDDVRTAPAKIGPLKQQVEAFEAGLIERALADAGGNQARAAAMLGVPLRTLVYKIGKYHLRDRDLRARDQGP